MTIGRKQKEENKYVTCNLGSPRAISMKSVTKGGGQKLSMSFMNGPVTTVT